MGNVCPSVCPRGKPNPLLEFEILDLHIFNQFSHCYHCHLLSYQARKQFETKLRSALKLSTFPLVGGR